MVEGESRTRALLPLRLVSLRRLAPLPMLRPAAETAKDFPHPSLGRGGNRSYVKREQVGGCHVHADLRDFRVLLGGDLQCDRSDHAVRVSCSAPPACNLLSARNLSREACGRRVFAFSFRNLLVLNRRRVIFRRGVELRIFRAGRGIGSGPWSPSTRSAFAVISSGNPKAGRKAATWSSGFSPEPSLRSSRERLRRGDGRSCSLSLPPR